MFVFFFQAEDGIRDAQESRGLGDVYKRQLWPCSAAESGGPTSSSTDWPDTPFGLSLRLEPTDCLLYTSDAADDLLCVDLGGRRIIKKKKKDIQDTMTQV